MIQQFGTMDEIREFFKADRFATDCMGACLESYDFETGEAVASLAVQDRHLNGHGKVMGGVYFTLADFALACCCNVNQEPTSSISSSINIMRPCQGSILIAIASPDRTGRRLSFYTIDVFDDLNNHCARMTATCARL